MEKNRLKRAVSEGKERLAEKVSKRIARMVNEKHDSPKETRTPEAISEKIAHGFRAKQKGRIEQRHRFRDEYRDTKSQNCEMQVPGRARSPEHPSEVKPVGQEVSRRKGREYSRDVSESVRGAHQVSEDITETPAQRNLSEIHSKKVEEIFSEVDSRLSSFQKVQALADRLKQELDSVESGIMKIPPFTS